MYNVPITQRAKGQSVKPVCPKCKKTNCSCGEDCGCGK